MWGGDGLRDPDYSSEVDGEDGVPVPVAGGWSLPPARRTHDARVVNEYVDLAEPLEDCGDGRLDGGLGRDVGGDGHSLGATCRQSGGDALSLVAVDVSDSDRGTLTGQHTAYAGADSVGPTRHNRYLPRQIDHPGDSQLCSEASPSGTDLKAARPRLKPEIPPIPTRVGAEGLERGDSRRAALGRTPRRRLAPWPSCRCRLSARLRPGRAAGARA